MRTKELSSVHQPPTRHGSSCRRTMYLGRAPLELGRARRGLTPAPWEPSDGRHRTAPPRPVNAPTCRRGRVVAGGRGRGVHALVAKDRLRAAEEPHPLRPRLIKKDPLTIHHLVRRDRSPSLLQNSYASSKGDQGLSRALLNPVYALDQLVVQLLEVVKLVAQALDVAKLV